MKLFIFVPFAAFLASAFALSANDINEDLPAQPAAFPNMTSHAPARVQLLRIPSRHACRMRVQKRTQKNCGTDPSSNSGSE
ncbi:hypothetical protein N7468_004842 [Penicillium chermesinum]|uniref:Uncharacterized protein n=1 Tax=Penicillium chermesinum TaxID=63820 RepID=A0A9W9PBJ5_9EURO|nr:uncharacterized protein N7468_004842 [Penicillium chermesinum]KAJ5240223.1 hypothetical protein N7468_004842 [Penicillium chermesinum]KAJ6167092.1 hypothetical protein N7470_002539 [Penicillium chermesinum]